MQLVVNPEELFRLDFDAIVDEAKRQEEINPINIGELAIANSAHMFFDSQVLRIIRENDWVFDSARKFTEEYSDYCFRYLKSAGIQTYQVQMSSIELKEKVRNLVMRIAQQGAIKTAGKINLTKASDFFELTDMSKLERNVRKEVQQLYEEAKEHEDNQFWVTLQNIRELYEFVLPRVMFVVRRVIKIMDGIYPSENDKVLSDISINLDWYESKVTDSHGLYPILKKLRPFYRVAQNVSSHHEGFQWDAEDNLVVLADVTTQISISVHEFQQNFRYLLYLSEFGLLGILSAYCGIEKGETSNELIRKYAKTFPDQFPEGIPGRVEYYVS
ncbi:MAG: hypothetical protein FVQ83_06085 [Chloroflexi bacterium]|nr:hypothetical protein [Chloroflexota bacterium]